jgi:molecular chaperone GrpE (heat shock protein)
MIEDFGLLIEEGLPLSNHQSKSSIRGTRITEMNGDFPQSAAGDLEAGTTRELDTLGSSTIYKLCEEVIALREYDKRQLRSLEQTLNKVRDELKTSFNSFAADTQRAYQQLRQETHGEKRVSMALLNELLEVAHDMQVIVLARPSFEDLEAVKRWGEAIEVQSRKVDAALLRHGIHPYDAVISSPYNPAIHERVSSKRVEGMSPLLVAEQVERGYASQQPEFVLRRPKVIVSE